MSLVFEYFQFVLVVEIIVLIVYKAFYVFRFLFTAEIGLFLLCFRVYFIFFRVFLKMVHWIVVVLVVEVNLY